MRFLAALLIWLSGGYLLYKYMTPIVDAFQKRFDSPETFQSMSATQILDLFVWPFFIVGILLWVALPGPRSRKSEKPTRSA